MVLHAQGHSLTEIATILGRHKSTISRELMRNNALDSYSAFQAMHCYQARRENCHPKRKLDNAKLFELVRDKFLAQQWSPEQIQHRLKLENSEYSISHNTIYRGIYAGLFDEKGLSHGARGAVRKLRHRGKTRHTKVHEERRGKIPISHHLTERPKEANERSRIGDWEADTVLGVSGGACCVTLADRQSRFLICRKVAEKKADLVSAAIIEALNNQPVMTITPDRGKEFARHHQVTEVLKVPFYFPLPHQPWQRGTNENTNGLLREYFPKQQDFNLWSDDEIQAGVDKLNYRPRKCLSWRTPYEIYFDKVLHLV
ncbi:Transposase [Lonepinella sp. MS14436]